MKRTKKFFAVSILMIAGLVAVFAVNYSVTPSHIISWTHDGVDVDGFEVAACSPGKDPSDVGEPLTVVAFPASARSATVGASTENATSQREWFIRATNTFGLKSAWSTEAVTLLISNVNAPATPVFAGVTAP